MHLKREFKYTEAVFIRESRQRFLCTVLLENEEIECYVSSSSKLSQYINLENFRVLLSKNKASKLRTLYTLEAAEISRGNYVYLNLNKVNQLFENHLVNNGILERSIYREKKVSDNLKVDFYIDMQGYYEIKALLNGTDDIEFRDTSSNRLQRQLSEYIKLLKSGQTVTFAFVALSSNIKHFKWNSEKMKLKELFAEATTRGLQTQAFSIDYSYGAFNLKENVELQEKIIKSYFD